jgi:hypothetical protein
MTLSDRGWTRETRPGAGSAHPRPLVRAPRPSRVHRRLWLVLLLAVLVFGYLLVPRHVTIGGRHLHPGFAPYLAPYLFG